MPADDRDRPDPDAAPTDTRDLEEQLRRLNRALRRVRGHGNQHLGALSMPQFQLVEPLLSSDGPLPVGTLAEIAGTTPPTATAMVRKLEDRGLVVRSRDGADARVVLLGLTDEGRELAAERLRKVVAWRREVARTVAPADRAAGARALAALADAVDASADALARLGRDDGPPS